MKRFGLDTSIVLRLLIGEPEKQAGKARDFLHDCRNNGIELFISDLVIGETWHALIYHYGASRIEAVEALLKLLQTPLVSPSGHAVSVLNEYRGTGAGLMDRLIRMNYLEQADEVITFDKSFSRLENVSRL
jgi:predicted nucleic-acid-binding protein